VYFKPPYNTDAVLQHALQLCVKRGVRVVSQRKVPAAEIVRRKILESQYAELHSFAESTHTLVGATAQPLPEEQHRKFSQHFPESWDVMASTGRVLGQSEASKLLNLKADKLAELCAKSEEDCSPLTLRRGLHLHRVTREHTKNIGVKSKLEQPLYVCNGLMDSWRAGYTSPAEGGITYVVLEFDSQQRDWNAFLGDVLGVYKTPSEVTLRSGAGAGAGADDGADDGNADAELAPREETIVGSLFENWRALGLGEDGPPTEAGAEPYSDCSGSRYLHCSSSAFSGMRDRLIWSKDAMLYTDLFGARLMTARFKSSLINAWLADPAVRGVGLTLLQLLRHQDSSQCIELLRRLTDEKGLADAAPTAPAATAVTAAGSPGKQQLTLSLGPSTGQSSPNNSNKNNSNSRADALAVAAAATGRSSYGAAGSADGRQGDAGAGGGAPADIMLGSLNLGALKRAASPVVSHHQHPLGFGFGSSGGGGGGSGSGSGRNSNSSLAGGASASANVHAYNPLGSQSTFRPNATPVSGAAPMALSMGGMRGGIGGLGARPGSNSSSQGQGYGGAFLGGGGGGGASQRSGIDSALGGGGGGATNAKNNSGGGSGMPADSKSVERILGSNVMVLPPLEGGEDDGGEAKDERKKKKKKKKKSKK
jgi:hypothetical protein